MINLGEVTMKKKKKRTTKNKKQTQNLNCSYIWNYPRITLITGGSGSGKTTALLI